MRYQQLPEAGRVRFKRADESSDAAAPTPVPFDAKMDAEEDEEPARPPRATKRARQTPHTALSASDAPSAKRSRKSVTPAPSLDRPSSSDEVAEEFESPAAIDRPSTRTPDVKLETAAKPDGDLDDDDDNAGGRRARTIWTRTADDNLIACAVLVSAVHGPKPKIFRGAMALFAKAFFPDVAEGA